MIVGTMYLIMTKSTLGASLLFALSVHFKTYPIIYAPSIFLLMNEQYGNNIQSAKTKLLYMARLLWPSDISLVYAVVGAAVTGGLGFVFYQMWVYSLYIQC